MAPFIAGLLKLVGLVGINTRSDYYAVETARP